MLERDNDSKPETVQAALLSILNMHHFNNSNWTAQCSTF